MNSSATADDDVKAIRRLGEEFFAGVATADLDRRMATMDPDAIIMPPDRPSIVGAEEIRRLSHDYAAVFQEECSVVYDEVETVGHWGFVRATVTGTRSYKSGGAVENVNLKNLWIVKRRTDGQWKFWRIMFNSTSLDPNAQLTCACHLTVSVNSRAERQLHPSGTGVFFNFVVAKS